MAIAFVGAWGGTQLNNNTGGDTSTRTSVVGNFVAAVFTSNDTAATFDHNQSPFTMTDSGLGGLSNTGTDTLWTQYVANIPGGAGHTIGINTAAGSFSTICAAEYSGMATSSLVDRTASGTGNSTSLLSAATATTTQADDLLIGGGTINTGNFGVFSGGGAFVVRSQVGQGGSGGVGFLEDSIVSTTGAYTASASWNNTGTTWVCTVVAFKGASSPGATASASVVTAAVSVLSPTITAASPKSQFAYDFDVEKKLLDDLAINWDDPDFPALPTAVNANVTATVVTAVTSVLAPTIAAGGSASVAALIVTATASVPAPTTVSGGSGASVGASVVTAVISVLSATVAVSVNASVTASVVTAATSVPSVTVSTPAPGVTDNFNRANGTLGSNWTVIDGSVLIDTNEAYAPNTNDPSLAIWTASTFADDQYAECDVTLGTGTSLAGPMVRCDGTGANRYYIYWADFGGGTYRLGKVIGGGETVLDETTGVGTSGPRRLRIEAEGTTIRGLVDDVEIFSVTDSSVAGGRAGMLFYHQAASSTIDDWAGGGLVDVTAASVNASVVTAVTSVGTPTINGTTTVVASVVTAAASVIGAAVTTPGTVLYPKSVSGRKLLDQNGSVFLLPTIASWGMASQLSNASITTRLTEVAAKGFKGVTVFIGGGYNIGSGWNTYTNQAGDQYWTTVAGGNTSATPWACGVGSAGTQLGAAWSTFDWIITETARLGLVLTAAFCGGFGTTGAGDDWEGVTNTQMYNAGVKIATRYLGAAHHMIWELMLDDPATTTASTRGTRIQNLFSGINDTEGSTARPVRWLEPGNGTSVSSQGWFQNGFFNCTINSMYTYVDESVESFETVWGETTGPTGDCEPPYVGAGHYSPANEYTKVRERNYGVFLEGGCLINFGHEDWWPFGAAGLYTEGLTPATVMASTSLVQASYCWAFVDAYVKDSSWTPSSFVTTGQGSGTARAACGASSTRAAAYFPDSRPIVVNTDVLTGSASVRLRWFDPSNGTYNTISASEAQTTSRSVTHPGNGTNSVGASDYVLIVETLTSTSVSASVVTAAVTVLLPPVISAGSNITPPVVTLAASVPNPTAVTATKSASVTAAVVTAATSVPAPGISTGTAASVTALVVTAPVSVLAPALSVGRTVTVTTVTAIASVVAPSASGSAVASPSVVTASVSVLAPVPHANSSATAAVVTAAVQVGAPAITAAGNATVSALVVTATTSVIAPSGSASSHASPPVTTAAITVLNPAPSGGASVAVVPVVTATVGVLAPTTVSVGRTITASVVTALVQVAAPGITTGGGVTVTAPTVTVATSVPAPAITAVVSVVAQVVTANVSVPAPTASAGRTVTAPVVTATTTVMSPSISAGSGASISALVVTASPTVPTPTVGSAAGIVAPTVTAAVSVLAPSAFSTSHNVSAPVVTVAAQVGSPSISGGGGASISALVVTAPVSVGSASPALPATVTAPTVTLLVSVPAPSLIKNADIFPGVVTIRVEVPSPTDTGAPDVRGTVHLVIDSPTISLTLSED